MIVEMKTRMIILSLISLLISSGCNSAAGSRAKWQTAGITSYRMKVAIQKPGHGTPMGTYLITVKDGQAVEILAGPSSYGGEVVEPKTLITDRTYPIRYDPYDTIDDYLAIIEDADRKGAAMIDVRYDLTFGYPVYLHIDRDRSAIDDELKLEVLEFTKL